MMPPPLPLKGAGDSVGGIVSVGEGVAVGGMGVCVGAGVALGARVLAGGAGVTVGAAGPHAQTRNTGAIKTNG